MAYDLILQTSANGVRPRVEAATVTREVRQHPSFAAHCEVTDGPTVASAIDVISLDDLFAEESSEEEFHRFCKMRGLTDDPAIPESAAAFLDSKWGTVLTFLKLPKAEPEALAVYAELVAFAKAKSLRIVDPQIGRDVDLNSPGALPPMWK